MKTKTNHNLCFILTDWIHNANISLKLVNVLAKWMWRIEAKNS